MIKNQTVANALQSALHGGEVSPIANRAKRRRTAHNARKPAVVLNVRPPSNPTKNRTRRIITAFAAALMLLCANAYAERTENTAHERLEVIPFCALPRSSSPDHIDNRSQCGHVKRQLRDGDCCAFAVASYADYLLWRKYGILFNENPTHITEHMNAKGTATSKGASLLACLNALIDMRTLGNSNSTIRAIGTSRDKLREEIKANLHRYGAFPCTLHTTLEWLDQYESKSLAGFRTGFITGEGKRTPIHTVLFCGYDDWGVIFQNCWGTEWGADGFGMIKWDAIDRDFICAAAITGCN